MLAQEAEAAAAAGHTEVATSVRQQVERMRRQVDYHLAHARAAASGSTPGTRASVKESAEGPARALLGLHAGRGITIDIGSPAEHVVRVQREDPLDTAWDAYRLSGTETRSTCCRQGRAGTPVC